MNHNPQPDLEALDEELVAYLDGELDEAAARRVEERLASDERARNRLRSLAGSWDLLDELPRAALSDHFTKSTVQIVTLAIAQEVTEQQASLPARRRRRWLLATVAALAAAMLGFVAFVTAWPDPNAPLLRDLSVVENLDLYRVAGDVEFLRSLDHAGLFTETARDIEEERAATWAVPAESGAAVGRELMAQRRAQVAALSDESKDDLRRRFERFQAMSAQEQSRMRGLNNQLAAEADQAQLLRVLQQYHDWLALLSPLERADLLEMQSTARLDRIRQLKQQEVSRLAGQFASSPLEPRDVQEIFRFVEEVVGRRKEEILSEASERQRRWYESRDEDERPRTLVKIAMWQGKDKAPRLPEIPEADWKILEQRLSKDVVARLSKLPDPKDRQQLLRSMLHASLRARDTVRAQVSQEELMRFYRDDLTAEERNRAAVLPPDEFLSELRRIYFQKKGGWDGPREGSAWKDGPRDGGGPPRDSFGPPGGRQGGPPADRPGPPGDGFGPPRDPRG